MAEMQVDESGVGKTALDIVIELQQGKPCIQTNPGKVSEGIVLFGPLCLKPGEPEQVALRLKEIIDTDSFRGGVS